MDPRIVAYVLVTLVTVAGAVIVARTMWKVAHREMGLLAGSSITVIVILVVVVLDYAWLLMALIGGMGP